MSLQLFGDGTIAGLAPGGLPQASVLPEDLAPSSFTASLGADVPTNNTANYFDGPSLTLGTGVWLVITHTTVSDSAAASAFYLKLWDGTTVGASAAVETGGAGFRAHVTLSAVITNPVGPVRASVRGPSTTTGSIRFNVSGSSKDSTITAVRIG
jgi:hypothetical protein